MLHGSKLCDYLYFQSVHCFVFLKLPDAVRVSFPARGDLIYVDCHKLGATALENRPCTYLEQSGAFATLQRPVCRRNATIDENGSDLLRSAHRG